MRMRGADASQGDTDKHDERRQVNHIAGDLIFVMSESGMRNAQIG